MPPAIILLPYLFGCLLGLLILPITLPILATYYVYNKLTTKGTLTMKFTIPSITITLPTINFPTTTTTTTKATIKQKLHTLTSRTKKLPDVPLPHSMAILNATLQDNILNKHSAHVNQSRLHHLSNTYNVSHLEHQLHYMQ